MIKDKAYWVLPTRLLAGPYPGHTDHEEQRANLEFLHAQAITDVINLTAADEELAPYQQELQERYNQPPLMVHRSAITDFGLPDQEQVSTLLALLDQLLVEQRVVYLHCRAGLGRTGTIVALYLQHAGLANGTNVLETIDNLRSQTSTANYASPETEAQRAFVVSFLNY